MTMTEGVAAAPQDAFNSSSNVTSTLDVSGFHGQLLELLYRAITPEMVDYLPTASPALDE